jgi:hypothetical protein
MAPPVGNAIAPSRERTPSNRDTKREDRIAKLAADMARTDGQSMNDTDVSAFLSHPVSWGSESIFTSAVKRFKQFIELYGPHDERGEFSIRLPLPARSP